MKRIAVVVLVVAAIAGGFGIGRATAPSGSRQAKKAGSSTTQSTTTLSTAATTFPFSVMFSTEPCFGPTWTQLTADKWQLRDAVTGATVAGTGTAYSGRCGFSVQFQLPSSTYNQVSMVYVFDPNHQLAGLDQSNAGDPQVNVSGDGGPYKLSPNGVVTGPMLSD